MDSATIRGLAFFGILLVASVLLWPDFFLRLLQFPQQVWLIRKLSNRHWIGARILFAVLFFALAAWLIAEKSRNPVRVVPSRFPSAIALEVRQ
jgi:hypothetical protein